MDDAVLTALNKWPDVPACYGWISLDERGRWHLGENGGERVRHAGLAAFLGRNYAANEQGEWFVQNGPQRAYVTLQASPWVIHCTAPEAWTTHTGLAVENPVSLRIDQTGKIYLACEHGLALVDDRDLPTLLENIRDAKAGIASEVDLLACMEHSAAPPNLSLHWQNRQLPVLPADAEILASEFNFIRQPSPPDPR